MVTFLTDHGLEILFGLLSAILGFIALRYTIKEHKQQTEGVVDESKQITIYLTRESMLKALRDQYAAADSGDVIWGQCIGCRGYSDDVREVVLRAASREVRFQIILNKSAPTKDDLRSVFAPLRGAEMKESDSNPIRIQGLSTKEVIVAFPSVNSYTSIRIREPYFLKLVRADFDKRWAEL
jgi:hypothetical protein